MLPFPNLRYRAPETLDEAIQLNADANTRIFAGGTDLLPSMKHRLFSSTTLVSLRRIQSLNTIKPRADGGITLGATVTLADVGDNLHVIAKYPALAEACRGVGTRTIRHMGTIGGNIMLDTRCVFYNQPVGWRTAIGGCLKAAGDVCHVAPMGTGCYAAHSADTVPSLWLYGAEVEFSAINGSRRVPLANLYDVDGRAWLRCGPNEILTAIHLPPPNQPVAHRKLRLRASIDYASLLVAVQRCNGGARAVISAVGPQPIEIHTSVAKDLPEIGYASIQPLKTHIAAPTWRKHMIRVEIARALADCS